MVIIVSSEDYFNNICSNLDFENGRNLLLMKILMSCVLKERILAALLHFMTEIIK